MLLVTTDRLSAFDVVLPDPIPEKGKVLNQISVFWFEKMADIVGNHLVTTDVNAYPDPCHPYKKALNKTQYAGKKADPLPIECIVRGYITGSGWHGYQTTGHVCGIQLPEGLQESDKLAAPLYTPSTKAEVGDHDINISFEQTVDILGKETAEKIRDLSLEIYNKGAALALEKGIIIADTKFEFGVLDNEIILIDEVLTPDSSRFWPLDDYAPGRSQKSLTNKRSGTGWSTPDGTKLPRAPDCQKK